MARPGVETAGQGEALDPQFLETRFMMGSPNPFRPIDDIQVAKETGSLTCPTTLCQDAVDQNKNPVAVFLYPVSENEHKDLLLICNRCGYEVVYRVRTGKFEPRPGRVYPEGFIAPRMRVARPVRVKPERKTRAQRRAERKVRAEVKAVRKRPGVTAAAVIPGTPEPSTPSPADVAAAKAAVSMLSPAEAALLLKLTEKQVRRAVRKGKLTGTKVDGAVRIPVTAIAEYLRG